MISVKDEQSVLRLVRCLLRDEVWPREAPPPSRELMRRHHLRPLAHRLGVPGLRDDYRECAALAALHRRTLEEIAASFGAASIPWLPIKGADYAWSLYPEPALRPVSDLDILVHPARFDDAMACLGEAGYRARFASVATLHAQTFERRRHEIVDLHRSVFQPLRSNAKLDEMWHRASASTDESFLGSTRFEPADRFLLHLSHMARHEFVVPLVSYVDAHQLLATLGDEEERDLRQRLAGYHLVRPMSCLLDLLDRLSGESSETRDTMTLLCTPTLGEMARGRHRNRQAQIRRKLLLFPRDALPLGWGWGRRLLEDAIARRRASR
jgi:hypothetical protein